MSGACFLLDFDDDDDLSTEYLGVFDSLSGLVFADEDEDEEE